MTTHTLLVARSVTHTGGHDAVHRLAAEVTRALDRPVHACFLDGAAPSLHDALDAAQEQEATEVVLVPTHLPPDRRLDVWLRRAHADWATSRADGRHLPRVSVSTPLASAPALVTAIIATLDEPTTPLDGDPGPFRSPVWSAITTHRRHVLVCRGPRCTAYGANRTADALTRALTANTLGDDDVLVTDAGCLFPCNLGPLVVVHPDDTWYSHVDPELAKRIVTEHLLHDRPINHRISRRR
ncbi:CbiX/SirB N-terminal domain-containing protein [Micromonospora sp. NPDC050397]|uniref:CbiX/SirB N-terminal domain-containing protein n=1 Tax=Micromonospora sp. NPDC050397 TaxID=3364279 RepID=UPI003850DFAF